MDPTGLHKTHGQPNLRQQPAAAPRRYDGQNGNPLYDPGNGGHYGTSVLPRARSIAALHLPPTLFLSAFS